MSGMLFLLSCNEPFSTPLRSLSLSYQKKDANYKVRAVLRQCGTARALSGLQCSSSPALQGTDRALQFGLGVSVICDCELKSRKLETTCEAFTETSAAVYYPF